jgi:cyclic-di-AMP phosphodiesterase PgpH
MLNGVTSINPTTVKKLLNGILILFGLGLLSLLLFMPYMPDSISIDSGVISKQTISSPRYISFVSVSDKERNTALKTEAINNIGKIYIIDPEINKSIKDTIYAIFKALTLQKKKGNLSDEDKKLLAYIPKSTILYINQESDNALITLEYLTLLHTEKILSDGLKEINKLNLKLAIKEQLKDIGLSKSHKNFISQTILEHIRPNLRFDEVKTNKAIQEKLTTLAYYQTTYKEGQPIIYKGEKVTSEHIEVLKALNIYGLKLNLLKFFGIVIICLLNFVLIERFLFYFRPKIHKHTKYFILIYVVILLICSMTLFLSSSQFLPKIFISYYLVPITMSAMIVSLLVTPNISLLCGSVISIFAAIIYKGDFTVFFYLFFSTTVAAFTTYKAYKRSELIYAGYIIGLANIIFVVAIGLFKEIYSPLWYGANMLLAFGNGIFSAMIALAILPYFESMFKITTNQSLLELSNLNHPLLKRLMMTTPGTYQHSIMVANLAETAAEEINANPVVCRVGAYFHDIGKMKRPTFYTENQFSGENPHDNLAPRISKMIISAHPKDGVALAEKYKLPQVLKDIMMEHHGTSLVSFFYSQAKQTEDFKDEDEDANKEEFRYPGPKPHFRESGIIMLADSVEAAVRSLKKPSPAKIEALINKIFSERIADNQLVNCPLTLQEIEEIKQTFLKVFKGVYHSRVNYEEEIKNLMTTETEKNSDTKKGE